MRSATAMKFFTFYFTSLGSFITSQLNDQLSAGSLAQVVERCTVEVASTTVMIVFTLNTIFVSYCASLTPF